MLREHRALLRATAAADGLGRLVIRPPRSQSTPAAGAAAIIWRRCWDAVRLAMPAVNPFGSEICERQKLLKARGCPARFCSFRPELKESRRVRAAKPELVAVSPQVSVTRFGSDDRSTTRALREASSFRQDRRLPFTVSVDAFGLEDFRRLDPGFPVGLSSARAASAILLRTSLGCSERSKPSEVAFRCSSK